MSTKRTKQYKPSKEQLALFPDISGNTINGLGETNKRRPRPIYWLEAKKLVHGDLQDYFYKQNEKLQPYRAEMTKDAIKLGIFSESAHAELVSVADKRVEDAPENWTSRLKEFALNNEADVVGITHLVEEWVFEGFEVQGKLLIVLGVAMNNKETLKKPDFTKEEMAKSVDETARQYNRVERAANALADWIRGQGWHADSLGSPLTDAVLKIPAAINAGLGQLGKHGSLINDKYGAAFRLSIVATDLPLIEDSPRDIGVDDFCTRCKLCTDICPTDAIFSEKQMVRGDVKWFVDFDKCIPYFNDTVSCGMCYAACPWSMPGVAPKLTSKMLRRRKRHGSSTSLG